LFYGAKGSSVTINGSKMDYVEFGLGEISIDNFAWVIRWIKNCRGASNQIGVLL